MKRYNLPEVTINNVKYPYVTNETLLGKWEQVRDIKASEITHRDTDTEVLRGLLFKGYEMKWGEVNTNGEKYEKTAFDKFIKSYFVEKGLNMPCTLEHSYDPAYIIGRVLYIETNGTGFYFVVYVPETCPEYKRVLWLAEQGLIQGFSKEGWITDGEWKNDTGKEDDWYFLIREIMVCRVSLVCTPANGVPLEAIKEIRNSLAYVSKIEEEKKDSVLKALFNSK